VIEEITAIRTTVPGSMPEIRPMPAPTCNAPGPSEVATPDSVPTIATMSIRSPTHPGTNRPSTGSCARRFVAPPENAAAPGGPDVSRLTWPLTWPRGRKDQDCDR
jgi:hypothetical protein